MIFLQGFPNEKDTKFSLFLIFFSLYNNDDDFDVNSKDTQSPLAATRCAATRGHLGSLVDSIHNSISFLSMRK